MLARQTQLDALTKRWAELPGEDVAASLALENLLIAQERLAESEFDFLKAQLTHSLSYVNLKKATGLLLWEEQVEVGRGCVDGLPQTILDKPALASATGILSEGLIEDNQPFPVVHTKNVPVGMLSLPTTGN